MGWCTLMWLPTPRRHVRVGKEASVIGVRAHAGYTLRSLSAPPAATTITSPLTSTSPILPGWSIWLRGFLPLNLLAHTSEGLPTISHPPIFVPELLVALPVGVFQSGMKDTWGIRTWIGPNPTFARLSSSPRI